MLTGYFLAMVGLVSKTVLHNETTSTVNRRVLTNCMLACQGGALVAYLLKRSGHLGDPSPTKALINGSLAGLVSPFLYFYTLFKLFR